MGKLTRAQVSCCVELRAGAQQPRRKGGSYSQCFSSFFADKERHLNCSKGRRSIDYPDTLGRQYLYV